MVVVKGNRELRSFAIVGVKKENGCPTKFSDTTRLVSGTPVSAAQKAFSRLCNLKRIRGKCTLFVTIVDTTQGARTKGKTYSYKVDRKKLAKPIILQKGTNSQYKINYTVRARKASPKPAPAKGCGEGKTHGPMKKTTPRKNKQEEKKKRTKRRASANKKNNVRSLLNRLRN